MVSVEMQRHARLAGKIRAELGVRAKAVSPSLGPAKDFIIAIPCTIERYEEGFNCRLESPDIWMRTVYSVDYDIGVYSATRKITFPGPSPSDMRNQSKQQLFSDCLLGRLHLVEEAEELASNVLAAGLLVVHDTSGGGQDDVAELTGGKELSGPVLEVTELDGVAGADDTALVETRRWM